MSSIFRSLLVFVLLTIFNSIYGQMPTPPLSTTIKTETTIGFTSIKLEYSRPSKKGRTVFGDFVPYNEIWRTGANKNSIISFGDDVLVGGQSVKKGSYALFSKPNKDHWEIYLYSDIDNVGLPKVWDESKIVVRISAKPVSIPSQETFTINIASVTNSSFQLEISWDNILVSVPIVVPTEQKVNATISKAMAGPSALDYYFYARYYEEDKKNLDQALKYINKSLEMMENDGDIYFPLRVKSLIQADLGDFTSAILTARQSLEAAIMANNNEYVVLNQKSIDLWSKIK